MRRPRAMICDGEEMILQVLEEFLSERGYEVLSFREPRVCSVYEQTAGTCPNVTPCADISIVDYSFPLMDGAEVVKRQFQGGCRVGMKNKALMSGLIKPEKVREVREMGCALFEKPLSIPEFHAWLREREREMDLSRPVGVKRREERHAAGESVFLSGTAAAGTINGTLLNISGNGLCLKTGGSLEREQVVWVTMPSRTSGERAVVRWVSKAGEDSLAGLEYT